MASVRASLEVERAPASPTTADPLTLRLTGLKVEPDSRSQFRPSRKIRINVDGVFRIVRSVAFQSHEGLSLLTWEVVSEAVLITTGSEITIQVYAARPFKRRKKEKSITIQGDVVLRLLSASAMPGNKYEYKHSEANFRLFLSFVAERSHTMVIGETYGGTQTVAQEGGDQDVQHNLPMTLDSSERCLGILQDLMDSLPSSTSELHNIVEETKNAFNGACALASTRNLDEDVRHLGEEVYEFLGYMMQEPMFSENLVPLTLTAKSVLNLVKCAAMFLEDYFKLGLYEDLADSASRKPIVDNFNKEFIFMKSSLSIGREVCERTLPYNRELIPSRNLTMSTLTISLGEGAINEPRNQGREIGMGETNLDKLRPPINPKSNPTDPPGPSCLGDTRTDLLSKVTTWLNNDSKPNILWLYGAPGTGKTAISCSLIEQLKRQQRCAGYFFWGQGEHTPSELWRTLAYKLARFHPAIESEIYSTVANRSTDELDLDDVGKTFSELVYDPLEKTKMSISSRNLTRTPVLLIDALDRCRREQHDSWETLLDTLLQWLSLPSHCKLIITSRPQSDIVKAFERSEIRRIELQAGDDVDSHTRRDVYSYFDNRFADMRKDDSTLKDWPNSDAIDKLVDHTKGFFKWAAVVVDTIQAAGDKKKQLATIVESGTATKLDDFDKYLLKVVESIFEGGFFDSNLNTSKISSDTPESHSSNSFQDTIGMNVFSKQPLTITDLEHFLQCHFKSASRVNIEDVCYRLSPIISMEDGKKAIKIRHKAYKDYLTDPKRCTSKKFFIDRGNVHKRMAISCLKIMQQELKFNICEHESSYRMNNEVDGKDALTKIPSSLAYACQYWVDHLRGIASTEKSDDELINLLQIFFESHLLYWLEVLSLRSKSDIASKLLSVVAEWLDVADERSSRLSLMAADASRFSLIFADVISASVPHIYLSALPFAPPSSLVSKRYLDQFPRTIKVLHEEGVEWPAMRFSISISQGDDRYEVYGISIHPDGRKVAAAMSDGVAMVFYMTTGETMLHLSGHERSVRAIEYCPFGKRIATGCDDGYLRMYDAENGSILFSLPDLHSDWIRSVAWSPNGKRIVTGSDDRKVKVVDVETREVIYNTAFHDDWVRTVLYTEHFFISGSDDRIVRIHDASTGVRSGEAWSTGQSGYIMAIAITPDSKILAAGSTDCSIVLYDMDARTMINHPIRGHSSDIRSLAFSNDGQKLASCSDDKTVRLWDVQTGRNICDALYGHTSPVSSVKFSPDMKQLVTGGEDSSIRFFDMDSLPIQKNSSAGTGMFRAAVLLKDGTTILASDGSGVSRWSVDKGHVEPESVPFQGNSEVKSKHLADIQSVSISPNGRLVATARNKTVIVWNAESGKILWGPLKGHTDDIYALNFSANSKMVVSGSDDQGVWIWSAETGQRIRGPMEDHTSNVRGVCFSPDGKQVASGSYDKTAIIWSVESGKKLFEPMRYHEDWIDGLAYSPDGHYLATASDDRSVAIWDTATGKSESHIQTGHEGYVKIVNWSPDSKRIVTGAEDNTIRIFDVETGSIVCRPLTGHTGTPTMLAFRPSSRRHGTEVLSASSDGTVRVWEVETKDFVETPSRSRDTDPELHEDWVLSVAFSPVYNHIASGGDDGKLIVVDVTTGISKFTCDAHEDYWVNCVTYSPDGTKISTCSNDGTICVWDADNGDRLLGPFDCNAKAVFSITFSPDGNALLSGNEDKSVRSWTLDNFDNSSTNTLSLLSTYHGHSSPVRTVAYAHMGEKIVSGSENGEIAVWEVGNTRDVNEPVWRKQGHDGAILSICVSGDKVFSSSKDKTIRVWDLDTGDNRTTGTDIILGHTAPINEIKLSPDGRWIVSASDSSLRVWDSETGKPFTLPQRMPFRILSIDLSRDGKLIACCGADNRVHTILCPDMAQPADVWPASFIRKVHGREYCPVDDQGILSNAKFEDGWLRGPNGKAMCWVPLEHRQGLLQQSVGVLGARETALDLTNAKHGTEWEKCAKTESEDIA